MVFTTARLAGRRAATRFPTRQWALALEAPGTRRDNLCLVGARLWSGGHDFSRAVKFCDRGFSPCGHSACDRVHSRQFPWTGIEFKSSVCRGVKIVFGSTHNFAFYRVLSNISNVYGVISCISNAMINVSAFPYFHVQSQLVLDPKGKSPFDELQSSFQLDF